MSLASEDAALVRQILRELKEITKQLKLLNDKAGQQSMSKGVEQARELPFQKHVDAWLIACFGEEIARDKIERNHRFLEEALELVQAAGCTASEAHQLVDYTFARPVGEIGQEVGGVMNTLAALCLAHDLDMAAEGDREMARVWTKVDAIREKQCNKPKHSPLPQHIAALNTDEVRREALEEAAAWHDQRYRDTPDAFEMEFHDVSRKAIRALSEEGRL